MHGTGESWILDLIQKLRPILVSEVQQNLQQQMCATQTALDKQVGQLLADRQDRHELATSLSQQLQQGWEQVQVNVEAKLSGIVTSILEKTELMFEQRLPNDAPFEFPDMDSLQPETETDIMGNPLPVQMLGHKRPLEVKPVACTLYRSA